LSKVAGGQADVVFDDGHVIEFGDQSLECRLTPGHTNGDNLTKLTLTLLVVLTRKDETVNGLIAINHNCAYYAKYFLPLFS
jgi:hypothetical protein